MTLLSSDLTQTRSAVSHQPSAISRQLILFKNTDCATRRLREQ
ncbi:MULTISPECIES: hypothetical protein [unclassified Moorena]|nr:MULTISPECIES: hypothetical protein [unclassified Moorena]